MYPLNIGETFVVQQTVTGTGVFDGTDRGRARRTITFTGGGVIRFASRTYGAASNTYTIQMIDPGGVKTVTTVEQVTNAIRVTLRRNGGGILATPEEIAAAVNAVPDLSFPVQAYAENNTGVANAVGVTPLTGGANPARIENTRGSQGSYFTWEYSNLNAGFFGFENLDPIVVRALEFKAIGLPGATTLNWYSVPVVPDYAVRRPSEFVVDEAIPIYTTELTTAEPFLHITDIRHILMPNEVLLLVTDTAGVAKVRLRREGRFPYL